MSESTARIVAAGLCPRCGTELAPQLLHCPHCGRLVHADALERLAAVAEQDDARGELLAAIGAWREAIALLPPGSRQHETVAARIDALGRRMEKQGAGTQRARATSDPQGSAPDPRTQLAGQRGPTLPVQRTRIGAALALLSGAGLLLWKFKFALGFLATKGKLLLLGLTKASTLFSMLLSMGLYWTLFGWKFAAGLILSIYVHEMGHVAALARLGIRATAPMFIPGFGAMVRLRQYPASPREDARVGLAGPLWGLAGCLVALAAHHLTGFAILAAIARVGAWLNLFNLIPVWQLDGSRGLRALTREQRWLVVATAGAIWFATEESLLLLVALVAGYRAVADETPEQGDGRALGEFVLLLALLGGLCALPVPGVAPG